MDDFRMEVDEHGNIKVTSYVEAVVISKEEQEQALRILKQLQEENDKLREQVTQLRDDWESERDYADQMEAKEKRAVSENAKLRELLADTLIDPRDYCAKYGIDYDGWDSVNDDIDRRLRELGIEVK